MTVLDMVILSLSSKWWCETLHRKGIPRGKSVNSGRRRLRLRRKCYQIILTLEMTGNLHTLLHSQATCIHRVHREDGYGDAPHGTNWKKIQRTREWIIGCPEPAPDTKRQEEPAHAAKMWTQTNSCFPLPMEFMNCFCSTLDLQSKS